MKKSLLQYLTERGLHEVSAPVRSVLTISREFGCLANPLVKQLIKKLEGKGQQ